ncbi:iron-sulfur cluster assembly scaffold protein [Candidatus Pacearchaeota archaeon]|nr:iron-sulfur cluster assembly scaffold protein [Candidatus Pacearchaeota archaeon]
MKHNDLNIGMYKEDIMELYKNPENFGEIENATHKHTEYNSFCGDEVTITLLVEKDKVKDAKFSGSGCVISTVSSTLLTSKLRGMKISEVKRLTKNDMLKLFKVKINPARIKCVLLPLEAVRGTLK